MSNCLLTQHSVKQLNKTLKSACYKRRGEAIFLTRRITDLAGYVTGELLAIF